MTFNQADLQGASPRRRQAGNLQSQPVGLNGTVNHIGGANVSSKGDQDSTWTVSEEPGRHRRRQADERIIFTITRKAAALIADPSDDMFTVDLRDQLDHPNASAELMLATST